MPMGFQLLGSSVHSLPKQKLVLLLSASLRFAYPEENNIGSHLFSMAKALDSDIWVDRASTFRLCIQIHSHDDQTATASNFHAFLKHLGEILSGAGLWAQLGLRPTIWYFDDPDKPEILQSDNADIILELQRSPTIIIPPTAGSSIVQTEHTSNPSITPPKGVEVVLLQVIRIRLTFAIAVAPNKSVRQLLKQPTSFDDLFETYQSELHSATNVDTSSQALDLVDLNQDGLTEDRPSHVWGESSKADISGDSSCHLYCSSLRSPTTPTVIANDPASHLHRSRVVSLTELRSDAVSCSKNAPRSCSHDIYTVGSVFERLKGADDVEDLRLFDRRHFNGMTALFDAAFRNLICRKPLRTISGILSRIEPDFLRLAEFAPSLFSPGYTAAVSERAALIPTIARSMSSSVESSSRTGPRAFDRASLDAIVSQGPLAELMDRTTDQSGARETIYNVKQRLKCCLWTKMARQLNDTEAARRLKPLVTSEHLRAFDELVDCDQSFAETFPIFIENELDEFDILSLGGDLNHDETFDDLCVDNERLLADIEQFHEDGHPPSVTSSGFELRGLGLNPFKWDEPDVYDIEREIMPQDGMLLKTGGLLNVPSEISNACSSLPHASQRCLMADPYSNSGKTISRPMASSCLPLDSTSAQQTPDDTLPHRQSVEHNILTLYDEDRSSPRIRKANPAYRNSASPVPSDVSELLLDWTPADMLPSPTRLTTGLQEDREELLEMLDLDLCDSEVSLPGWSSGQERTGNQWAIERAAYDVQPSTTTNEALDNHDDMIPQEGEMIQEEREEDVEMFLD